MALLIKPGRDAAENWVKSIGAALPDLEIRVWPEAGNRDEVEFLIANQLPPGEFATFRNLKFIAGTAVGVERLLNDPDLPPDVPILRQQNQERAATMSAWVLYHLLGQHRRFGDYRTNQKEHVWSPLPVSSPTDVRVGIMGLGNLGLPVARRLADLMYDVAGWSRSPRRIEGMKTYAGPDQFDSFLARSDFLVSILPNTPETRNLLNEGTLARLPRGAYVINAGRGSLIDEDALLTAIDAGHLSGAALDVFQTEPLPGTHPFWDHPRITITPHHACQGRARFSALHVIDNIRRIRDGLPPAGLVDREAGY